MSNSFNAILTLGRDAELKYTPSNMAILSFTGANNVGYGEKKQTIWIRCSIFGKRAEGSLKDYLVKGAKVFVTGELSVREYTGKDGINKTSIELNLREIELVGGHNVKDSQTIAGSAAHSTQDDFDDDIPF